MASPNFTIAHIGKHSSAIGGPAAGTIRNSTGKIYRDLISIWKIENERKSPKCNQNKNRKIPDWIESIFDISIKVMVLDLYCEKKKLESEMANLRMHLKPVTIDMRSTENTIAWNSTHEKCLELTQSEVIALKHSISEELLSMKGWSIDERGRILDENNRTIFKVGYGTSLKRIISIFSN